MIRPHEFAVTIALCPQTYVSIPDYEAKRWRRTHWGKLTHAQQEKYLLQFNDLCYKQWAQDPPQIDMRFELTEQLNVHLHETIHMMDTYYETDMKNDLNSVKGAFTDLISKKMPKSMRDRAVVIKDVFSPGWHKYVHKEDELKNGALAPQCHSAILAHDAASNEAQSPQPVIFKKKLFTDI